MAQNPDINIKINTQADLSGVDQARDAVEALTESAQAQGEAIRSIGEESTQGYDELVVTLSEGATGYRTLGDAVKQTETYTHSLQSAQAQSIGTSRQLTSVNYQLAASQQAVSASSRSVSGSLSTLGRSAGSAARSFTVLQGGAKGLASNLPVLIGSLGRLAGPAGIVSGIAVGIGSLTSAYAKNEQKTKDAAKAADDYAASIKAIRDADAQFTGHVALKGQWEDESRAVRELIQDLDNLNNTRRRNARYAAALEDNQYKLALYDIEDSNMTDQQKAEARYKLKLDKIAQENKREIDQYYRELADYDKQVREATQTAQLAKRKYDDYYARGEDLLNNDQYAGALKDKELYIERVKKAAKELADAENAFKLGPLDLNKNRVILAQNQLTDAQKMEEKINKILDKHEKAAASLGYLPDNTDAYFTTMIDLSQDISRANEAAQKKYDEWRTMADAFPDVEALASSNAQVKTVEATRDYNKEAEKAAQKELEEQARKLKEEQEELSKKLDEVTKESEEAGKALDGFAASIAELKKQAQEEGRSDIVNYLTYLERATGDGTIDKNEEKVIQEITRVLNAQKQASKGTDQLVAATLGLAQETQGVLGTIINTVGTSATQIQQIKAEISQLHSQLNNIDSQFKNSR